MRAIEPAGVKTCRPIVIQNLCCYGDRAHPTSARLPVLGQFGIGYLAEAHHT